MGRFLALHLNIALSLLRLIICELWAEPRSRQLMYDMYIRVAIFGVLSRHSSIYRIFFVINN